MSTEADEMTAQSQNHDIAGMRKLLTASFDDAELDAFTQDCYLEVYDKFGALLNGALSTMLQRAMEVQFISSEMVTDQEVILTFVAPTSVTSAGPSNWPAAS